MLRMLPIVITLLISAPAQGPSAIPVRERWAPAATIRVWVDRRNMPAEGDQLVDRAMRAWTTAAAGAFTMQRTFVDSDAGIRVYFNGADGNYGETRPHFGSSGFIDAAIVNIASEAPIEVDALTRNIIVYLTALHELGHAVGLGHTRNFDDIMYLFRQPGDGPRYFGNYRRLVGTAADIGSGTATGLSAYDVAALRALYEEKK